MTEISSYTLESLRKDGSSSYTAAKGKQAISSLLRLGWKQPAQGTLRRLEHEYGLRSRLDPAWAVLPLALVRDDGRTMLVLEDPGGEPLDRFLERRLDLTRFLRIAIGLSTALGKLHEHGIIHKDIKPPMSW